MGLFSSKKKITVNTTVSRVFEDDNIPNSVLNGIMKGIVRDADVVEYMLDEVVQSLGVRTMRGMNWIRDKGYYWGIPTSLVRNAIDAQSQVKAQLAIIENQAVTTQYIQYGPQNSIHFGWQYIYNTWQYNAATNELPGLSAQKGTQVYLIDMIPVYAGDTATWNEDQESLGLLDNWGYPPNSGYAPSRAFNTLQTMGQYATTSPYRVDPNILTDRIEITYEWIGPAGTPIQATEFIELPDNYDYDYHQVRYTVASGQTKFWTYQQGAGTYPLVDGVFSINFNEAGTYLPWCYYRYDNKPVSNYNEQAYNDSRDWARYLGVDYDTMNNAIHQDNNVDDVAQVIMFFGLNPATTNQSELRYLFEYFVQLHANAVSQRDKAQSLPEQLGDYSNSPDQNISIRDKFFRMDFSFSGIKYEQRTGRILDVGKVDGAQVTATFSSGLRQTNQQAYRYRKQVADTLYQEVTVFNPQLKYQVYYKKGFVGKTGDPELLIPVDSGVLGQFSLIDKEQILSRGLHLAVNTLVITKSPWYASGAFKAIMVVVAIIVTIYSFGSAWGALAAAAAVGVSALVLTIIQMIVVTVAVNYSVKLFVKEVGPEVGILAAIAAAAYGVYGMNTQAAWSETLLAASNNLATTSVAAQQGLVEDAIADLTNFQEYANRMFEQLNETAESLGLTGGQTMIDPVEFVGRSLMVNVGETPSAYFDRTIRAGNVGARSFELTSTFVDAKLTLPQLSDTLEA